MKKSEVIARAKSAVMHDQMSDTDMRFLNAVLGHISKFDGVKYGDRYNFEDIEDMLEYMVSMYNIEPGNLLIETKHDGRITYRISAFLSDRKPGEPYTWVLSVNDDTLYGLILKFTVGMFLAIKERNIKRRVIDQDFTPSHKILK